MQATMRSRSWFWGGEEPEWLVVLTVIVAIVLGWALTSALAAQTHAFNAEGISLRYPADWQVSTAEGPQDNLLRVGGYYGARTELSVRVLRKLDPAAPIMLEDAVTQRSFEAAQNLPMYRALSSKRAAVGGKPAIMVNYAYVHDPGASAYQDALPTVMIGRDYIVAHAGKVYLFSMEAQASDFDAHDKQYFQRIVNSIRLR